MEGHGIARRDTNGGEGGMETGRREEYGWARGMDTNGREGDEERERWNGEGGWIDGRDGTRGRGDGGMRKECQRKGRKRKRQTQTMDEQTKVRRGETETKTHLRLHSHPPSRAIASCQPALAACPIASPRTFPPSLPSHPIALHPISTPPQHVHRKPAMRYALCTMHMPPHTTPRRRKNERRARRQRRSTAARVPTTQDIRR